jgi:hypothetical protein
LLDQKEFRPYRAAIKECLSWRTYSAFYLRLFATEQQRRSCADFMAFTVLASLRSISSSKSLTRGSALNLVYQTEAIGKRRGILRGIS